MKKRLALVLVLVLMASAATTAFASPFADVPADHWAYDSVAELAAAGLIEGYPDGTYGGARMMTRYEAAMVFARALNRLESQIANNNLLPELDKIKAELMAEIEAQMAAAGKPVVETRVVETVLDEETPARVRANEIAIDALEGDMAYLEARMLGLIDGIRYDMNRIEEQGVAGVEQPSMDEIEALIAARVQESLLDVASGVKETTIVERVVSTTPELTRADVELIAEALIRKQVQELDRQVQENRDLIVGLVEWVDEIDTDVATLKDDVAGLKSTVAELDKQPRVSGSLSLSATKPRTAQEYRISQTGNLNLEIKASDATTVKSFLGYRITPADSYTGTSGFSFTPTNYRVEVASETPVSRVVLGRLPASSFGSHDFSKYVLNVPPADPDGAHAGGYAFGGIIRANILDDLTLDLFAGREDEINDPVVGKTFEPIKGAAALTYTFMPEIGVRITGALEKPVGQMFENYAAGIGLFGKVVGIDYTADVAKDFNTAVENDYLGVLTAKTTFEPVTIDGKFIYQGEGYRVNKQLVDATGARRFGVEGGVAAELEFFGVNFDLGGRVYYEGGESEPATVGTALAVKLDASAEVDFIVPLTFSATYAGNKTNEMDYHQHASVKVAIEEDQDYGLRYGASAQYVRNHLTGGAWKNVARYGLGDDRATFKGNLGYGFDWDGAKLDVDYDATYQLPLRNSEVTQHLQHGLTLGYGFTKNVKLTIGGNARHIFDDENPTTHQFGYNAGLTVSF